MFWKKKMIHSRSRTEFFFSLVISISVFFLIITSGNIQVGSAKSPNFIDSELLQNSTNFEQKLGFFLFTGLTISSGTLWFLDCESADERREKFLSQNEGYIPKLQNDTNLALVLWVTLVLGNIYVIKKILKSPRASEMSTKCSFLQNMVKLLRQSSLNTFFHQQVESGGNWFYYIRPFFDNQIFIKF